MATVTPNFNWPVPTSTDLVKDGATAIEALGDSIDASLVDLKGGTTGQVLAKATNTNMDFVWVAQDDSNAIQNSIVDAKGDLIAASANDTPARLAVGSNGETLVADSSTSTGLRYTSLFGANKNVFLNADFRINQRGFTSTTSSATYGFDRWRTTMAGGTITYSAQTFTPGAAPVAGYEAINYARLVTTGQSAASDRAVLNQLVEDVRVLSGQTVTVSFWAQAGSGTPKVNVILNQNFGTGGSSSVNASVPTAQTISTSWARYSFTFANPSVSGKTISATDSRSNVQIYVSDGGDFGSGVGAQNNTFNIWGVQMEAGSVATPFATATGTIQGELAACQRYYYRNAYNGTGTGNYAILGDGQAITTTTANIIINFPVTMRNEPQAVDFSGLIFTDYSNAIAPAITSMSIYTSRRTANLCFLQVVASSAALTVSANYYLNGNGSGTSYVGLSAEL
jgi:hypothetical protein